MKLFKLIKYYFANSSFHGYHYLVDSGLHWTEKIFWLASIIISTFFGIYLMLTSVDESTIHPISFTVDSLYLNWKNVFPAITFCERTSKAVYNRGIYWFPDGFDFDKLEILSEIIFFTGRLRAGIKCEEFAKTERNLKCIENNFTFFVDDSRLRCHDLFSYCAWNDVPFNCCDRFLMMDTIFGKCFATNSIITNPPTTDFLHITYNQTGKLTVEVTTNEVTMYTGGAEDAITYSSSIVLLGGTDMTARPDTDYNIYIKFKEIVNDVLVKSIPIKYRQCRFPDENYLRVASKYSHNGCTVNALSDLQYKTCNCNHHLMPGITPDKMCDLNGLLCQSKVFAEIVINSSEANCLSSCTETEIINLGLSSKNISEESFYGNNSVTRINFIASAPSIRYYRKVVRDYVDMIGNVGGIGTLFFGASILSVVEIFYYFFVYPCSKTKTKEEIELKELKKIKKKMKTKSLQNNNLGNTPIINMCNVQYDFDRFKYRKTFAAKPLPYIN